MFHEDAFFSAGPLEGSRDELMKLAQQHRGKVFIAFFIFFVFFYLTNNSVGSPYNYWSLLYFFISIMPYVLLRLLYWHTDCFLLIACTLAWGVFFSKKNRCCSWQLPLKIRARYNLLWHFLFCDSFLCEFFFFFYENARALSMSGQHRALNIFVTFCDIFYAFFFDPLTFFARCNMYNH